MSTAVAPLVSFRWRSWLGAAVVIFLINGLVNILAAIVVPLSLSLGGTGALGSAGVVFSGDGDAALLGRPLQAYVRLTRSWTHCWSVRCSVCARK